MFLIIAHFHFFMEILFSLYYSLLFKNTIKRIKFFKCVCVNEWMCLCVSKNRICSHRLIIQQLSFSLFLALPQLSFWLLVVVADVMRLFCCCFHYKMSTSLSRHHVCQQTGFIFYFLILFIVHLEVNQIFLGIKRGGRLMHPVMTGGGKFGNRTLLTPYS